MSVDVGTLFEELKSWGRWGGDDERGALNLLTAERVQRAARLVTDGVPIACGRRLGTAPALDDPSPSQHMMLLAGDDPHGSGIPGFEESMDFLGISCHGMSVSHIDALCHVFVGGRMYNGVAASEVKSTGARRNSIASAAGGITGRGVLLDIPHALGRPWLEPGEVIGPDELDECCRHQGTVVEQGDIILVHTGRDARRESSGPWNPFDPGLPGLGPDCLPWLGAADPAVLGTDVIADPLPASSSTWPFPIHQCAIAAMGVHLIDNLNLLELVGACRERSRWEFLFCVEPLNVLGATASPVNPVAIL